MTRGHRGSLLLRCRASPSPPSCRFIPALSDDRDVVAFVGGGFAVAVLDQDDADRVGAPDPEPEAGDLAGLRGDGGAVPVDEGVDPGVVLGGVVGDVGGGADAFAAESGSAAFPAGGRGGVVEHGVAAGSGGDAHVVSEAGEVSGAVGGVADEVNCP